MHSAHMNVIRSTDLVVQSGSLDVVENDLQLVGHVGDVSGLAGLLRAIEGEAHLLSDARLGGDYFGVEPILRHQTCMLKLFRLICDFYK